MSTLNSDQILEQYRWRYATKHFDSGKKIPEGLWSALEDALVLSPSSFGLQPWKFVVITDPAIKAKLRPVSWNQPQIEECSHLVVFTMKKGLSQNDVQRYVDRIAQVRSIPIESLDDYRDMMLGTISRAPSQEVTDIWTSRQIYIALGFFLATAAVLGVDACPMEGIESARYDEILELKDGYTTLCIATAGYRAADDAYGQLAKVRFSKEQVIDRR